MNLKEMRKYAGLSTKEAVELLNISFSYLYKIENGSKVPGRQLIQRISKVYKCSIEDIFLAFNTTMSGKAI